LVVINRIARHHGYEIVLVLSDEGVSGATDDREQYFRLLELIKANRLPGEVVFIDSLSRLNRDLEDRAHLWKRLSHRQIPLIDRDGLVSAQRAYFAGMMDEEFLRALGNNMRRTWEGRIERGMTPGKPCYGYRLKSGEVCVWEIDPVTSKIVIRIFREYVDGVPVREIAARLNAEGIPSPSGGLWNHQCLTAGSGNGKGILGNRKYVGELVWNQFRSIKSPYSKKRNKQKGDPKEVITRPREHLRIIDQDLWAAAEQLRKSRNRNKPDTRVYKKTRDRHSLATKLVCGTCGGHMKVVWSRAGESSRVGCGNARDRAVCTNTKSYSLEEIELTVLHGSRDLDVEALVRMTKGFAKEFSSRQKTRGAEGKQVAGMLRRLTLERDNLIDAIAQAVPEVRAPLVAKYQKIELERAAAERKVAAIENENKVVSLASESENILQAAVRKSVGSVREFAEAIMGGKLEPAKLAAHWAAVSNFFEEIVVMQTGKRKRVEIQPRARIGELTGVELPRPKSPKEVMEEQGLTNLLSATVATLEQLSW
jgi:site-specific DNA recombinase